MPDGPIDTQVSGVPATCATGRFGADMTVTLDNDGPVTVILDSRAED